MGIGLNYCKAILSPSLSFDWLNTNSLTSAEGYPLTFTRASQATYWGSDGLLKTASNNEARFEYDPNTLVKRGLKIEPQATNLLLRSEDYANVYWGKTDATATLTTETLGIRGNSNEATKIQEGSTGTSNLQAIVNNVTAGARYCCYFIVKKGTLGDWVRIRFSDNTNGASCWFNINTKTKGSISTFGTGNSYVNGVIPLANDYMIIWASGMTGSSSINLVIQLLSATGDLNGSRTNNANYYLCGSQVELGQYPTSYIPTTTAIVTRSADLATMSTGAWYNASEGSVSSNYFNRGINTSTGHTLYALTDGSFSNRIVFRNYATSNGQTQLIGANGSVNMAISLPLVDVGVLYKMTSGFKLNDYALCINNTSIFSPTGSFTSLINRLDIGSALGGEFFNGHIQSFRYYNRKLPNATLQALTA